MSDEDLTTLAMLGIIFIAMAATHLCSVAEPIVKRWWSELNEKRNKAQ